MLQREACAQHIAGQKQARATDAQPQLPRARPGRRQSQQEHISATPGTQFTVCKLEHSGKDSHALQPWMQEQLCSKTQHQPPNSAVLIPKVTTKTNITAVSRRAGSPENLRSPVFPLPSRQKQSFLSGS